MDVYLGVHNTTFTKALTVMNCDEIQMKGDTLPYVIALALRDMGGIVLYESWYLFAITNCHRNPEGGIGKAQVSYHITKGLYKS